MTKSTIPFRRIVRREEVPEAGLPISLRPDDEARVEIARMLDLPGLEALSADLEVVRWRSNGLVLRGRLEARVVQTCVVTLEPVHNKVDVEIEDFFAPERQPGRGWGTGDEALPATDEIELLVDDRLDVAGLVVEHLALNLDPYPRRDGVEFDSQASDTSGGGAVDPGPFAALEALKRRRDKT